MREPETLQTPRSPSTQARGLGSRFSLGSGLGLGLSLALGLSLSLGCRSVPTDEAGDTSQVADNAVHADSVVVERLLALTLSGQVLGTVESRLEKGTDGTWTTREFSTFSMTRQGGGADAEFSSTTESVTVYDPAHELVSDLSIEREAGITITRRVTMDGPALISSYTGPGHETPKVERFTLPPEYRSSLAVNFELLETFEHTGEAATLEFRSFNADRERFELSELTLLGTVDYAHGDLHIPGYEWRVREEDGTVIESITDLDFMPLKLEVGGVFAATLVDEPPEMGGAPAKIDSELPVGGKTATTWWELAKQEVVVSVEGDVDPDAPPMWENNHYHRVERDGPRYTMTLLSTRPPAGFQAPGLPMTLSDPELSRYLEPTPMAQSDDPLMIQTAQGIIKGEKDSFVAAQMIIEAVFQGLSKEAGVRGSATAIEVLRNGRGDCTEHAVLVVALMRAAGIPARAIDGIVIAAEGDGSGVAGYHEWAEIWLGEWIGVDATVGETGTSARYLEFSIDEPGNLGSGGKMMRSIGKTKIELGPHELYEGR